MRGKLALWLCLGLVGVLAAPAAAIMVWSHQPNATVYIGIPFNKLEFENPLSGAETVLSHKVLEWRDADYAPGPPRWYDDWTVSDPSGIDGNANEIWLRAWTHEAKTSTTVPSTIVSVHLVGDDNDGVAKVFVDGQEVAVLDMGTPQPPQTALILVTGLANTTHDIRVYDDGSPTGGFGDDVAILGAAALAESPVKWEQPPDPAHPGNVFYGWNEVSSYDGPQIAADDWVCQTPDPVSDIHWWGSFKGWRGAEPPMMPAYFHVTIWTDVPAGPNDTFSHPGQVVWEADLYSVPARFVGWDYDPRTNTYESCFRFDVNLPPSQWFYQDPAGARRIYWVSIAAAYPTPPGDVPHPWGWKTRPRDASSPAPDDAVVIISPTTPHVGDFYREGYPLYWPTPEESWDLAFELTSTTLMPGIKWEQPPKPAQPDNVYYGWNEPSVYAGERIAADDWACTTPDPVTDIHWWGSFKGWTNGEPPQLPQAFHIGIWTDVPKGPNEPFSHPGQMIWQNWCSNYRWKFVGWDFDPRTGEYEACFRFDQDLLPTQYFYQDPVGAKTIYWVSISAVYPAGTVIENPWGWKTRPRDADSLAPDDAVRIFAPTAPVIGAQYQQGEPIFWPDPERSWDLAFELTTKTEVIKWRQDPNPQWPGLHAHDYVDVLGGHRWNTLADDWRCEGGQVTDLHWWGNYELDSLGQERRGSGIRFFRLSIHENIPGLPYGLPGPQVWGVDVPIGATGEADTGLFNSEGSRIYLYSYILPDPFPQEPGKTYWLDITAYANLPMDPPMWRWQEAGRNPIPTLSPAVYSDTGAPWKRFEWGRDPILYTDLAFAVTSGDPAVRLKWSQPPAPYTPPNAFYGWNEWSIYNSEQIVADDWACVGPLPVTDIHWWGSYRGWTGSALPTDIPMGFHIGVWTDVPQSPGGTTPWSHPGTMIWQWVVPRDQLNEHWVGTDFYQAAYAPESCFFYNFQIPASEWFYQQPTPAEAIYWISISAIYPTGTVVDHPWGWKTRLRDTTSRAPDDAVRIWDPTRPAVGDFFVRGQPIEDPPGVSWDTAFVLTTMSTGEPFVKWSQPPVPYKPPDAYNGWNELSMYDGRHIAADDWVCTTDKPVTDIHWWGSFIGWSNPWLPEQLPDAFHIAIWTDVPGGGVTDFSHPGKVIWENWCENYTCYFAGWDFDPRDPNAPPEACFKFEQDLLPEQWFRQNSAPGQSNIYWVSIAAVYRTTPAQVEWGWKTRPRDPNSPAPDDAVRIFDPTSPALGSIFRAGEPVEFPAGKSWDLAFTLTTVETPPDIDWGDAPDPTYPTLGISGGASHVIVPGFCLGAAIDAEADGQPNASATGDDLAGVDDEDGVVFNTALFSGVPATLAVVASAPGLLQGWIDFNGDGDWDDGGERIITDLGVAAGSNTVRFAVPAITAPCKTYARFRLSSVAGLSYRGGAPDGEVEDYQVQVNTLKWLQRPDLTSYGVDVDNFWVQEADDFRCTQTGPITDVHIWTSFAEDILPPNGLNSLTFKLFIYSDVPDPDPTDPRNWSHPGELLWSRTFGPGTYKAGPVMDGRPEWWYDPATDFWHFPGDTMVFQYDFYIHPREAFWQREGRVYWLGVKYQEQDSGCTLGWKTSLEHWNDDACWLDTRQPAPVWKELRYGDDHPMRPDSIDLAFAMTVPCHLPNVGTLTIKYNHLIRDHFWWPNPDPYNEMISLVAAADPIEAIQWDTVTLQSYGTGNDAADITAVEVWLDLDNNGQVNPMFDSLIGSGAYPADNGTVTIALSAPPIIPAGGTVNALISYTMAPVAIAPNSTYQFDVVGASGTGQTSGQPVAVNITPYPLTSAKKIVGLKPISIGHAKKLPIGTRVFLEDKVVTADFSSTMQLAYIEEQDRSAGIGVVVAPSPAPGNIGDRVSLLATTALIHGTELVLIPEMALFSPGLPLKPVGMNNRTTGGARFGGQPGVIDDALVIPPKPAYGLNNVGLLERTWGNVTGSERIPVAHPGGASFFDVFWIDDGSALHDGFMLPTGAPTTGVAVLMPAGVAQPPSGFWAITGIMRAIPNPAGQPVRLLVPRGRSDMTSYTPGS